MSNPEDFAVLASKLEDGCNIGSSDADAALISIAISLKRVADALDALAGSEGPTWLNGLNNVAWEAGRSFESGRKHQ